jgi:Zn-finger nucleic acid-binding protein
MGESPYRVETHVLLCPRCGDVLRDVFAGVSSCVRCEGLWLAQPTIDRAFGDPTWPGGTTAWWRRELNCPVCATDGTVEVMTAILHGNVVIDHCRGHGTWLDAGELGRILHTPNNGVEDLYLRLFGTQMPDDMLRKLTGDEIARRRHEATETRARIDKLVADRAALRLAATARIADWQQGREQARQEVERLEAQIVKTRELLRRYERELVEARAVLRGIEQNPPRG